MSTQSKIIDIVAGKEPANQGFCSVPELVITLSEAKERVELLQIYVNEYMCPGQDFGIIPGCNKPSLLKPGAEKLCHIFGYSKHIEILNRIEDYVNGFFSFEVKAILVNKRTDTVEAEGIGICNSRETKYVDQDPYNITNTLIKMAKKRAFIDAVLSATRSSGIFTQDMEDTLPIKREDVMPQQKPRQEGKKPFETLITQRQSSFIKKLVEHKNISPEKASEIILKRYNSSNSSHLSSKQASDLIKYLQG